MGRKSIESMAPLEFLQAERKSWMEHTLQFDPAVRESNISKLVKFKDGQDIYLINTNSSWAGVDFQHWFITDRVHFLEFGGVNMDIYNARVTINTLPDDQRPIEPIDRNTSQGKMNEEIRNRMSHVLGMNNYSLCLRNSEHVANYVFYNRWTSSQIDYIKIHLTMYVSWFIPYKVARPLSIFLDDKKYLLNTLPDSINPEKI